MTTVNPSAPVGDFAASVLYSQMLAVRKHQSPTFMNNLSGKMPVDAWMKGLEGVQTSPGMPVIQLTDLQKNAGDRVTVDMLDRIGGKPVMGDRIAENKGKDITMLRDEVKIDQSRIVLNAPGRMAQQRSIQNFRKTMRPLSADYFADLDDNLCQVHMAGARGDASGIAWKLPLESDPDFQLIAVNDVLPPTRNRYVGLTDAVTDPGDVTTTNKLTLNFFDDLRTINDTSEVPLQGVKLSNLDGLRMEGSESGLLVCYISSEQWNQLQKDTSDQNWRTFMAQALERKDLMAHPLFRNRSCGIWRDIVICQGPRPIQFSAGSTVKHYNTNGGIDDVTVGTRVHRGVLLGAQALGVAYGNAERYSGEGGGATGSGRTRTQKSPYTWVEELKDGRNRLQLFTGVMQGMKKLRYDYTDETGKRTAFDNGVFVFDSYVPQLRG